MSEPNPYGRDFDEEERRYCNELQKRMLEWEIDPRNFLTLQKAMLGLKNTALVLRSR